LRRRRSRGRRRHPRHRVGLRGRAAHRPPRNPPTATREGSCAMTIACAAGDAAYWALAIFLVLVGVGSLIALVKLGQLFDRISSLILRAERDALPVVVKTGGTVDRVNYQLDKLDTVTDSAVSMADNADTAVRAVLPAIAAPVEKGSRMACRLA